MKKMVISVCLLGAFCFLLTACGSMKADKLAAYGEEQFLENDFEEYMDNLRNCGLDDLKGKVTTSYEYEYDYKKDEKTLYLDCGIYGFTSDKIDDFYTDGSDKKESWKLGKVMCDLKKAYRPKEYVYTMDSGEKVVVKVENGQSQILVKTSEEREYKYSFVGVSNSIYIDGDYICQVNNVTTTNIGATNSSTTVKDEDELNICWALARDAVKTNLKSPSSAKFPFSYASDDVKITKSGDVYTVKSWVEAQNSFGATLRTNFTVTMLKSGSGTNAKFTVQSCYITE